MARLSRSHVAHNLCGSRLSTFQSHDLDETRGYVSGMFIQHHLEVRGAGSQLSVAAQRADLGPITLVHLQHGAEVFVDPEALNGFYLLQIPVSGFSQYVVDGNVIDMAPGGMCVLSPDQGVTMHLGQDCRFLLAKIDGDFLQAELAEALDGNAGAPLRFQPDLRGCGGAAGVLSLIRHLEGRAFAQDPLYARPDIQASTASLLVRSMLQGLPHSYSDRLEKAPSAVRPRYIRMAQSFIEDNLTLSLNPTAIAQAACVSSRALHRGFRQFLDITPMAYVKDRRLLKIRELLQHGPGDLSITELGLQFGFEHLGRFAASYQQRFGELPSRARLGRR